MTKNILLAATALTVIGLGGAAQAGVVTGATVSGTTPVATALGVTTDKVYYLASTTVQPVGATNFTSTAFSATFVAGTSAAPTALSKGTYLARFNLGGTGNPSFATAISDADVTLATVGATCAVTAKNVTLGGGAGQNFAEVTFTIGDGAGVCGGTDRPTSITLSHAIAITAAGSVTVGGTIGNVATGEPLGAGGVSGTQTIGTKTIVDVVAPYALTVTPDTVATRLSLSPTPAYSALTTGTVGGVNYDAVLGTIGLALGAVPANTVTAATVYAGLAANGLPTVLQTPSVTGSSLAKVNLTIAGTAATETGNTATIAAISGPSVSSVVVVADAGTPATQISISPLTFTGAVALSYPGTTTTAQKLLNLAGESTSGSLQTVSLEGTNFVAPWFALQSSSLTTFLRLSNTGTTDTGPVTLTLRANNGGTVNATCTLSDAVIQDGTLSAGGGLRANSQVTVSGKTIAQSCFGTTSTNADILVTIQGNATELTAKTRALSANGNVTETSLGRLGEAGVTF